ncbi:hypothetical protein [Yersinia enterocolitica]|uniref:hypothetical protein n=1 Tax=Yersinia enterocolitica TaxID=630 RepID=UPI003D07B78B
MNFNSLADFALHFAVIHSEQERAIADGLETVALKIETTAKAELGQYQSSVGPFPGWDNLADSTEQQKVANGYPLDAPLLASGEMRDSITHEVSGMEAVIGSTDQKMVFHEFGTAKMPPRPVLGTAVVHNGEFIKKIIGKAVVNGLVGGARIHPSLGYDDL